MGVSQNASICLEMNFYDKKKNNLSIYRVLEIPKVKSIFWTYISIK